MKKKSDVRLRNELWQHAATRWWWDGYVVIGCLLLLLPLHTHTSHARAGRRAGLSTGAPLLQRAGIAVQEEQVEQEVDAEGAEEKEVGH
jgi:hypothetical protein